MAVGDPAPVVSSGFTFTPGAGSSAFPQGNPNGLPLYNGGTSEKDLQIVLPGQVSGRVSPDSIDGADPEARRGFHNKGTALQGLLQNSVNDPDGVLSLQIQLIRAGILQPSSKSFNPTDVQMGDATYRAFSTLLDKSIATGKSYQELLDDAVSRNVGKKGYEYFVKKFGPDGQKGAQPSEWTTTSTNMPSELDARGLLRQAAQQMWGRNPTDSEVDEFAQLLQSRAQASPTVTSGTYDPSQGKDTQITTSGGLSAGEMGELANQYAQSGDHAVDADSHALTNIQSVFSQMLGGVRTNTELG